MYRKQVFRIQITAISIGILLMAAKFIAWWLTNSNAILTDALESIINVVAGFTGLYSLWLASKPRDRNHPYGHGKIEFISAGFEGALILLAGGLIIAKGAYNLVYPQEIRQLDVGILLVGISGAINYLMGFLLKREGGRSSSITLHAAGAHLQSDAYSSAGLLVGLGLLWVTGMAWLDNAMAILFGGVIFVTGIRLLRSSIAGIMDEADYQLIEELVKMLDQRRPANWIDVHNFRVIKYGATLHIDCHLTLPWYFEVRRGYAEVTRFEKLMREHCAVPVEVFIHTDPCDPPSACRICWKEDCEVRKAPPEERLTWTLENIMQDRKHHPSAPDTEN